ncbi:MAG: rhodanese-related sulfurtransferase [Phormidium sp. GEM2.Bin31]|nr:MAG: rhodanese-related sulfurtransferase [Phormidium sp. GEM2.Bin31]
MSIVVATFYQFVPLDDLDSLRSQLLEFGGDRHLKGTLILAPEGINATVAGPRTAIDDLMAKLRQMPQFQGLERLEYKESQSQTPPFQRFKVRIKPEIVTFKQEEINPQETVGTYIQAREWNQLISNPEVTLIDTRNDFEVEIGTFKGAQNPKTSAFTEFPDYIKENLDPQKTPKVAMFCTGGIRCEKATSYLLKQGFKEVYHLKGGILKYLEDVPEEDSLWEGDCFVFDERVAVRHGLERGDYELCLSCGHPLSPEERNSPHYDWGISCPHCYGRLSEEKRRRREEKVRQLTLQRQRQAIADGNQT